MQIEEKDFVYGSRIYVQRSSYLDRVRAARFPGSERSSLATGSAPPRHQDGAASDLPGKKKRKIRIPKIKSLNKPNNPVRQPGVVITPISLKSLSTLSVVISAARQPDSPSSHRRSGWSWSPAGEEEEEGADPSGRGGVGRSWVTQLLRRNVTAARALRTAAAAAASSAGGTRGEMLGWRWTEQWDRAAVFFLFCLFLEKTTRATNTRSGSCQQRVSR